ncbi:MAG TPA: hypothetical protein VHC90_05465 [Bryobacteraceae bacterium]|nr:hypothetical protein [Bryobacteraceae bacterium]
MKKVLTIALAAVFGLAAQAPAKTTRKATSHKATAKATVAKTSTPKAVEIPKDAVARPDGTYSWTDKQGKNWVFAKTPFGVMKTAAESSSTETPTIANAKAIDAGDKVRFETSTPFGVISREKNKTDLTDEERKLYESQNSAQPAKQD